MSNYCFYSDEALVLAEKSGIKSVIDHYAKSKKKQTYVLCRPLSKDDSSYDYENAIVIFSAGIKPCFVNIDGNKDAFEEYVDDFLEDVAYLSEKFKYRDKIGRKKKWEDLFEAVELQGFSFENLKLDKKEARIVDLIISLIVGSINDMSKVNLDADNILDSVKSKIILFDTDQTSFVFKAGFGKKYVIQGLAGSGKTELLLHKLKEIYSKHSEAKIAFTCFNKILASTMKSRIPEFFDFMRVERQIDWGNKLFVSILGGVGGILVQACIATSVIIMTFLLEHFHLGHLNGFVTKPLMILKRRDGTKRRLSIIFLLMKVKIFHKVLLNCVN